LQGPRQRRARGARDDRLLARQQPEAAATPSKAATP
jgi:hypothetical protein